MAIISLANISTGFHAGDRTSMDRVVRLAGEYDVGPGAHPGYRDLPGFERRKISASAEELVNDIVYQVGALREFGRRHGLPLPHVKPHGALYTKAAVNKDLSRHLLDTLTRTSPTAILFHGCVEDLTDGKGGGSSGGAGISSRSCL